MCSARRVARVGAGVLWGEVPDRARRRGGTGRRRRTAARPLAGPRPVDVRVERGHRPGYTTITPHRLAQRVDPDGLAGVHEEQAECRPQPGATHRSGHAVPLDLERAQVTKRTGEDPCASATIGSHSIADGVSPRRGETACAHLARVSEGVRRKRRTLARPW